MAVELSGVVLLVLGALLGSVGLLFYRYSRKLSILEQEVETIKEKPEDQWTPEERFKVTRLENKESFSKRYGSRITLSMIGGVALAMAQYATLLANIPTGDYLGAFMAGITSAGLFTAIGNEIQDSK